jgi:hypothetical protein
LLITGNCLLITEKLRFFLTRKAIKCHKQRLLFNLVSICGQESASSHLKHKNMIKTSASHSFSAGLVVCLVLLCSFFSFAQEKVPASPPASATAKIGTTDVTVKYSSPAVKGRKVWGELVPYGEVWRTGANEATTITFSKDVTVEGQKLAAGTYALFTVPGDAEWTIVFNKTAKQWGAFKYDQAQDALRVKVKPVAAKSMNERMKIDVQPKGKGAGVVTIMWENLAVPFNVKAS